MFEMSITIELAHDEYPADFCRRDIVACGLHLLIVATRTGAGYSS